LGAMHRHKVGDFPARSNPGPKRLLSTAVNMMCHQRCSSSLIERVAGRAQLGFLSDMFLGEELSLPSVRTQPKQLPLRQASFCQTSRLCASRACRGLWQPEANFGSPPQSRSCGLLARCRWRKRLFRTWVLSDQRFLAPRCHEADPSTRHQHRLLNERQKGQSATCRDRLLRRPFPWRREAPCKHAAARWRGGSTCAPVASAADSGNSCQKIDGGISATDGKGAHATWLEKNRDLRDSVAACHVAL